MNSLWVKIAICILICQAVGFVSSFATASSIDGWFLTLEKPSFNPPNWLFAPVWILLYTLMGAAAGIVWHKGIEFSQVKLALGVFFFQVFLNGLWSVLFFGLQNPAIALIEILLLWLVIGVNIYLFSRISIRSAGLMVPYLLWVTFAAILNGSIWYLNINSL